MKYTTILLLASLALGCRVREETPAQSHQTVQETNALEIVVGGRAAVIHADGAAISVFVREGPLALSDDEIVTWVRRSVHAVATYYGRFPVASAAVKVDPIEGSEIGQGQETPHQEMPVIRLTLGSRTRSLDDDWVLVHEMVHLAMPSLSEEQLWFEEGVASYVEPIARVQSGRRKIDEVLHEWVRSMPQGEPERGDQGLDRTHTWGRTYWGGALFCLLADVTIRERTSNRFGLQDALIAVLKKLGDSTTSHSIDDVIAAADAAVGVPVLRELYAEHARKATPVDLQALWKKLGIQARGRRIVLDDEAPLAGARKAIFEPRAETPK
jgi:hypothetical protein